MSRQLRPRPRPAWLYSDWHEWNDTYGRSRASCSNSHSERPASRPFASVSNSRPPLLNASGQETSTVEKVLVPNLESQLLEEDLETAKTLEGAQSLIQKLQRMMHEKNKETQLLQETIQSKERARLMLRQALINKTKELREITEKKVVEIQELQRTMREKDSQIQVLKKTSKNKYIFDERLEPTFPENVEKTQEPCGIDAEIQELPQTIREEEEIIQTNAKQKDAEEEAESEVQRLKTLLRVTSDELNSTKTSLQKLKERLEERSETVEHVRSMLGKLQDARTVILAKEENLVDFCLNIFKGVVSEEQTAHVNGDGGFGDELLEVKMTCLDVQREVLELERCRHNSALSSYDNHQRNASENDDSIAHPTAPEGNIRNCNTEKQNVRKRKSTDSDSQLKTKRR